MKRYTRSVGEIWDNWKDAAKLGVYPFDHTAYEDHERVLTNLRSLDREEWAKAYSAAAEPFENAGRSAERKGDLTPRKSITCAHPGSTGWPVGQRATRRARKPHMKSLKSCSSRPQSTLPFQ